MITSWKHKGLQLFFETGNKSGINAAHMNRLKIILQRLNAATMPNDLNTPSLRFHKLTGNMKNHYSVSVNGNWRVTFTFEGTNASNVDYLDYH